MVSNQTVVVLLLVILGALVENYVEACSCLPSHPQDQYCQSDFVIVARIRREFLTDGNRIYKAKIKKEFKMSEKAKVALKSGRIITALDGGMCGVRLDVGKVYLITGRVSGLQAHVSLCGFVKPLRDITPRQRKGFRLIYGRGCDCKVSYFTRIPQTADRCSWNNIQCQRDHGICLRSPSGLCHWSKSLDLKKCMNGQLKSSTKFYPDPIREKTTSENRLRYHHWSTKNEQQVKTS